MNMIEPESVLFLNRSLPYIRGTPDAGLPGTSNPIAVSPMAEHRLTLTGTSLNPKSLDHYPTLSDVAWILPRLRPDGFQAPWANRDILIFGHLLGLVPLRWKDGSSADPPTPQDFLNALIQTHAPGLPHDSQAFTGPVAQAAARWSSNCRCCSAPPRPSPHRSAGDSTRAPSPPATLPPPRTT